MLTKLKVAKSLYSLYSSGSLLQSTRLSPFLTNSIQYNFSRDNRDQDGFKPSSYPNKNFNDSYQRKSPAKRSFDNDRGNSNYQRKDYQAQGQPRDSIDRNSRFEKETSEQNQRQSAYPKRQSNYNDRNTRFRDRDEGENSFRRAPSGNKRFENRNQRFNNEGEGENSFRRAPSGDNKRFENRNQRFNNEGEGENSFRRAPSGDNKRFENRNQRFNNEGEGENSFRKAPYGNKRFENRNQRFNNEGEGENSFRKAPYGNKRFENRNQRFNKEEGEDQGEGYLRRAPSGDNKRFENRNQRFNKEEGEDQGEGYLRRAPAGNNKRFENRNQRFNSEEGEDQGEGYLKRAPSSNNKRFDNRNQRFNNEGEGENSFRRAPSSNKNSKFMEDVEEDEGGYAQESRPSYGQKRDFQERSYQAPRKFNNNRDEEQQSWGSQRNPRYQQEDNRAPSYDRKPTYQNSYDNRRQPSSYEKPRKPYQNTRRSVEEGEEEEEGFDRTTSIKDLRQRQPKSKFYEPLEPQEQAILYWEKLKDYQVFQDEVITRAHDIDFVSEFLKGLVSERVKATVFEKFYFKNFNFLISEILEGIKENPPTENDTWKLIDILHSNSLIFLNLGKLETSKIQLLQKKLATEINSKIETLPTNKVFDYIESLANFGVKSSVNLGKINGVLTDLIRDIDPKILPKLLRYLVQMGYRNEGIIEIITEKIYKNLSVFDLKAKINLLTNLNLQQYKPNKIFLIRLCDAISQDIEAFPYGELYYPHGPGLLFSLTELEKRYTGKGFYMDELDKLYNQIIFSLKRNIEKYTSLELCRISIGLQRCSVYDQELLESISREIMKKDFFGFEEGELSTDYQKVEENIKLLQEKMDTTDQGAKDTKEYKELLLELKNNLKTKASITKKIRETMNNLNIFSGIVHCFAVFKYYNADFFKLLNQVIELYYLKFLHEGERYVEFLSFQNIPKLIWSLSVLGQPQEVKKSINYLMNILLKSDYKDRMSHVEITQLYYAVIYLRDTGVFDQATIDFMSESFTALNKGSIKTISMVHLDICKQLENLEIEHTIEERVDQLAVDIILEKRTRNNKKLIIDFHGYNHFFRNTEELKGNALFKRKVLESLGHEYVEITIFDWLLLGEDKKTDYIKTLVSKYVDL